MSIKKSNINFERSKIRIFEQSLIDNLIERLACNKVVALYGDAGVGKTAIAKEVACQLSQTHNVFWLNCETESTFNSSLDEVSKNLSTDFDAFLRASESESLIIMDNVDYYEQFHKFIINQPANVQMLITTRDAKLESDLYTVKFEGFGENELKRLISAEAEKISKKEMDNLLKCLFKFSDKIGVYVLSDLLKNLEVFKKGQQLKFDEYSPFVLNLVFKHLRENSQDSWNILAHISYLDAKSVDLIILKEIFGKDISDIKEQMKILADCSLVNMSEFGECLSMSEFNQKKFKDFIEYTDKGMRNIVLSNIIKGLRKALATQRLSLKQASAHAVKLLNYESDLSDRDSFIFRDLLAKCGLAARNDEKKELKEKKTKIYVAFQWNSRREALNLCKFLNSKNTFEVLIDENDFKRDKSLNERIAFNVLEADLVVLCKTKDFIESERGRKVMQYANLAKKKSISVVYDGIQVSSRDSMVIKVKPEQPFAYFSSNLLNLIAESTSESSNKLSLRNTVSYFAYFVLFTAFLMIYNILVF